MTRVKSHGGVLRRSLIGDKVFLKRLNSASKSALVLLPYVEPIVIRSYLVSVYEFPPVPGASTCSVNYKLH